MQPPTLEPHRLYALAGLLMGRWQRMGEKQYAFLARYTGQLNDAVDALDKKFNERQCDYEVKPLYKGTYPETLTAAMAAYRSRHPRILCKSSMLARKPCCSQERPCLSFN